MIKAIVILPGTALVYVPALLIWLSRDTDHAASFPPESGVIWALGLGFALPALGLMGWTMRLFRETGSGSPAPWDPIETFIVQGPYRYVRNPMLIGVHLFLVAEGILLDSIPILAWMVVFWAVNTAYFKFREEPELLARYGEPYAHYKRNVPRWIPRLTPYDRSQSDANSSL